MTKGYDQLKKWGPICGALFAIGTFVYYIAVLMRYSYTSDYADTLYWTNAMFESGRLFDPTFEYAALFVFGGQWFYAPFYLLFGFSLTTQVLGQIFFLLCFSAALLFFARSLNFSWSWSFTTVLCVLGVLTTNEKLREVYFAHILYYGLGTLFFLIGFTLCMQAEKYYPQKRATVFLVLCGIWMFLVNLNKVPSLSTCTLPFLFGLLLELILDVRTTKLKTKSFSFLSFSFFAGMAVLGVLLGSLLTKRVNAPYQVAFSSLVPAADWNESLVNLLPQYLTLFTGGIYSSVSFTSARGIDILLRLSFALALLVLPVLALFTYNKFKTRGERVVVLFHFLLTGMILFAFLFGGLHNANWRLSPTVVSGTLVSLVYIRHLFQGKGQAKRIGIILLTLALLFCMLFTLELFLKPAKNPYQNNEYALAKEVLTRGYTYGYATFWNAGAVTVLTDNKVKIRNVSQESDGTLIPYEYQSSLKWFSGQGESEKYVLILTGEEYSHLPSTYASKFSNVVTWQSFYFCELKADLFGN
ncbi:MAG: hypothetical protein J6Z00_04855 [Clostridia bacterium]|nr:hypothetical protein [Clostridia bacterium]